jgi:hypothetical protein
MRPNSEWITDWRIGESPAREDEIAHELLDIFLAFWDADGLGERAKTTQRRYSAGLHGLGGYLVNQANFHCAKNTTTYDLVREYVGPEGGPLIWHDNEMWQCEIDMVCRRLHKHLRGNR